MLPNTMNTINTITSVYGWFTADKLVTGIKQLSDNQILNMANEINGLFSETNLVEYKPELTLPRIVVVGTQSSGKSSVLNAIMGMDILPTGKNMVTRTPLDIRLHQIKSSEGYVEFGDYASEGWIIEKKILIKTPTPLDTEITSIREFISQKTIEIAGPGMNVNPKPILVNIYSPTVPNLSLVDLPGLTIVACTDKGQPEDIKDRIEELVTSYIKQSKTIVLAVMQARSDLETDIGLGLVKKYDVGGQRIIGVITKPDLMNSETHVGEYLINNISKNLMLTFGYYVVKNRNGKEMETMNTIKGFELEKEYFTTHLEYKKTIYKDRVGTTNLSSNLSRILINSITEMLPSVMTELAALEAQLTERLEQLGQDIPSTKEGKLALLNKYVSSFYYKFLDSVESRGTTLNTGKLIKDSFIAYRKEILQIKPFEDTTKYNAAYFANIISSFDGNHMSFHIPPIQVLESCMTDKKYRPIMTLQGPSYKCVDDICDLLIRTIRELHLQDEFAVYPQLASAIMSALIDEIISRTKTRTKNMINELLKNETDYIWTDSDTFAQSIIQLTKNNKYEPFLESYFQTIKNIIVHSVPKIIMSGIVREAENTMLSFLLQSIVTDDKLSLLKQDEKIERQRIIYNDLQTRVFVIKKSFLHN